MRQANPYAWFDYSPVTKELIRRSLAQNAHLCLFEPALVSDGAATVLLTHSSDPLGLHRSAG